MHNTIIFDASVVSDYYLTEVCSNYCPGPDIRVFADFDIAHDVSSFADKCRGCYFGALAVELSDHGFSSLVKIGKLLLIEAKDLKEILRPRGSE
jgi:hypothetical protein